MMIDDAEQMIRRHLERRGYRIILDPCEGGMIDPVRRYCRYGHADPSIRLAILTHEYAHLLTPEPAHHGGHVAGAAYSLGAMCHVWLHELAVWRRAWRIVRRLDPSGFAWRRVAQHVRRNFARELRDVARSPSLYLD